MTLHVVVIGGGLIGASIAAHVAAAGANVTLLTKGQPGDGASGATFAWLNAQMKLPDPYMAMNMNGMSAHRRYAERHASAPWYHPIGGLEISIGADGAERQAKNFQTMREHGYAARWVTRDEVLAMEPDIAPSALADARVSYFPDEGYVDAVPLVTQLCLDARAEGATIIPHAEVTGFEMANGRIKAARCRDGSVHSGDVFVNAAGPHGGVIAQAAGCLLPMANTVGLQFFTPPAVAAVRHILHAPHLSLRPDGGGRLCLHDNGVDQDINARHHIAGLDAAAPEDYGYTLENTGPMLAALRSLYPSLSGIGFEAVRVGIRPIPIDRQPVIGFMDGCENLYCAIMHSGVTQSIWVGELAAGEIAGRAEHDDLATFRSSRFADQAL